MRVYGSNAIRNVAFVGHGACGKTSLVDALAFVSGASRRHGSIKDGTTLTDYSPDEIERKHSISLGLGYAEWLDTKINLIDTPGYLDYFGEVVTGLHADQGDAVERGQVLAQLDDRVDDRASLEIQGDAAAVRPAAAAFDRDPTALGERLDRAPLTRRRR